MNRALRGLRVLVTRPAHQADGLCQRLEAEGAEAARLPLFAIEPTGEAALHAQRLAEAQACDGWIFTSTNAVRIAAELHAGPWPTSYAVGAATASALEALQRGQVVIAPEAGSSSEALLDRPELASVTGRRLLIVTGEDGRDLLQTTLEARGAAVETLPLYRRRAVEHEMERVIAEVELADAVVLTSGEALDRLWALTPPVSHASLLGRTLVVPSTRVQDKARELGFAAPLVPETVSDEAIVRRLLSWREAESKANTMTDTPTPPPAGPTPSPSLTAERAAPPPPASQRPSRAGAVIAWFLVLVLAGALGYGGWLFWDLRQNQLSLAQAHEHALRTLSRQATELESTTEQLSTRQSDLARVLQRESTDVAGLQGRIENSEKLMGRISDELQGGRTRFAMASVEQLLLLANDRLLLEHDIKSALVALQLADERLGQINDPRLFRVREAIAEERTRLQALPRPDLTSASLTLSSLIDRAENLPLRARVAPKQFGGSTRRSAIESPDQHWTQRIWSAVREAVSSLFLVRRDDNSATLRLLPAEDEAVLVHVLILKLESARVALLRGNTASFRESTRSAADWLRRYFRAEDPGVIAALAEIERLQPLELSAPPPDITGSLTLLRQALDQSSPQSGSRE
ncbi:MULTISPECIES: uroporphyrinogen-III C-methyltransferase [Hydrocarboniphaga]|jgi:uncharacterized protein HemX/uroporphyrinogen-III synthase|uniref:Tetrapyrrole biosynthesis uroporphyrinogen III synthase domain-containing protein n=1 Tax=Hydrocarboniphaga effusa AP103 TaxID=1172194 RepID=I7ZJ04_9GAMM|nr:MULTISPECIES: uroporphyrinogen-III C-methyltransferase [Hydrocarboniphaga]EIT71742.1 hypothetical protein WQQ_18790 [Hydrocarboniphaga effusa AP103]MDZ4080365.1 uroporphyrinogen-III C-methyltransferase [Hydrocarboniphaga sp.]